MSLIFTLQNNAAGKADISINVIIRVNITTTTVVLLFFIISSPNSSFSFIFLFNFITPSLDILPKFIKNHQISKLSTASTQACISPSKASRAYSSGSSIAKALNEFCEQGVVLNPSSALLQSIRNM